jgi:hypothetical protein
LVTFVCKSIRLPSITMVSFIIITMHKEYKIYNDVRFEVFAMVTVRRSFFWDIMLCSPLKVGWHFIGKCCHYFQDQIAKQSLLPSSCWFHDWLILQP